jgi:eukaryotic-like serine/threonine-protein kinase
MEANESPEGPGNDLVGRVLSERYRVLAKLGEGAMGAVYLAEHLTIGRRDAIKVLRPGLAQDTEAIARFTRGTRNVSAIQHPNVCAIYDFSDTPDGIRFLAMEYVEGETLKDLLDREGRLEPERAVALTRQVAEALQAAHDVGVVHRDLKPGNIMVRRRPDGREMVKVVDFDIAKGPSETEGTEVTRVGYVVGTPEYMSPEQLIGERLDGRSDLYSLAIVLFRMLSGQLPFGADTTQELMLQRLTGEPLRLEAVLPGAPPGLDRALGRALARKKEDRQASVSEFADEITAVASRAATAAAVPTAFGRATAQSPEPPLAPTRIAPIPAHSRGWRRLSAPMGVVGAILLVIVVAFLARPSPTAPPEAGTDAPQTGLLDELAEAPPTADPGAVVGPEPVAGPSTPATPPSVQQPADAFPGGVAAVLERQLEVLYGQPGPGALRAVRDTADRAWRAALTRADSTTAALVLAQAAYRAGDTGGCARWAQRGLELGGAGFEPLLAACR